MAYQEVTTRRIVEKRLKLVVVGIIEEVGFELLIRYHHSVAACEVSGELGVEPRRSKKEGPFNELMTS